MLQWGGKNQGLLLLLLLLLVLLLLLEYCHVKNFGKGLQVNNFDLIIQFDNIYMLLKMSRTKTEDRLN